MPNYLWSPFCILSFYSFVFILNILVQHRNVYFPFPWHHIIKFCQTIFEVLHHCKVSLIIRFQTVMQKGYSKKLCIPSSTISLSTSVFGLTTLIVCFSLGIVSKNSCTFSNCSVVICSIKSCSSFLLISS